MWTRDVAISMPPPYDKIKDNANLGNEENTRNAGSNPHIADPANIINTEIHLANNTLVINNNCGWLNLQTTKTGWRLAC